jgi:hypothetical protein
MANIEGRIEEWEYVEVFLPEQGMVVTGHDAEHLDGRVGREIWRCCSGDTAVQRRVKEIVEITEVAEHRYGYTGQKREQVHVLNTERLSVIGEWKFRKHNSEWVWVPVK